MSGASDTHNPENLWIASQLRMQTADETLTSGKDYAAAAYLAGLSIELLLQALAHLDGTDHDARHRLDLWLAKCSRTLQQSCRTGDIGTAFSFVAQLWRNDLRYRSNDQWLGQARRTQKWRKLKGGDMAKMKTFTRQFVNEARRIHQKGASEWQRKQPSKS